MIQQGRSQTGQLGLLSHGRQAHFYFVEAFVILGSLRNGVLANQSRRAGSQVGSNVSSSKAGCHSSVL